MRKTRALVAIICAGATALMSSVSASASTIRVDSHPSINELVTLPDPANVAEPEESLGPYYIRFYHSNKCIAIPGNSTANNVQMHQWNCFATNREQWYLDLRLIDANGTYWYWIRSAFSNKCLAIGGNSPNDGAPIVQWDCRDANNQYFAYWFHPGMPFPYYWLQARSSYGVISVENASETDGAKLIQWGRCSCPAQYVAFSLDP